MRKAWYGLLLLSLTLNAQEKSSTTGWTQKKTLPKWAQQEFKSHGLDRQYAVTYQLYPYYFNGDFNGDGRRDIAFLVKNKSNNKSGIVFIHGKRQQAISTQYFILGAGKPFSTTGDNTKWIDIWSFIQEDNVPPILGNVKLPSLHGDVLKVEHREGKKGLIHWDGKRYEWFKLK